MASAKIVRDRKRRLAYHERQKLERKNLRRQVEEMSLQLGRMRRFREVECVISAMAWKAVAMQQWEARQTAEQERKNLLTAVQSQGRLIQKCSYLVQQTRKLDDANHRQHKRIRLEPSDMDIYEGYVRELNMIYAQTDAVFRTDRVSGSQNSSWKVDTRTGSLEFQGRKTLPFDFKYASEMMWQLWILLCREEGQGLYEGVQDPENTVALKFNINARLPTGRIASAVQRVVGRRYREKDRVVGVWRSFTEGGEGFEGMHSDETGWCVIKRTTDGKALLDIFIRNIPMHFSTAETDKSAVEQFTDLVCNSESDDIFKMAESLDKISLNDP
eukprot:jgi/Phyca11/118347/e_gw1.36.216.1